MSINRKGYKKIEPLDDELPIYRPMKIRSILQLLFEEGIYSVSGLMDILKVDKHFLTTLTGIEQSFFDKYLKNERKVFTVKELEINKS